MIEAALHVAAIREALAHVVESAEWVEDGPDTQIADVTTREKDALAALDALVGLLQQAERERDEALNVREGFISPMQKVVQLQARLRESDAAWEDMREYNGRLEERAQAAEARVRVLEEALRVAQRGLRKLIRGGYIEEARGALSESEEIAAAAAPQETA